MTHISFLDNLLRFTAKFCIHKNKHKLAVQMLERINDKTADDLLGLAMAYVVLNDGIRVLKKLEEAVQKDPDGIQVNERIGSIYNFLGYPDKALPYLNKISTSLKSVTSTLVYSKHLEEIGTCHRDLKEYTIAEEFYRKSLEIFPYNIDTIYEVVNLYKVTGKFDLITPYLHDLLKKFPDMYPRNAILANFYLYSLFDFESAIYYFEIFENVKNQPEKLHNQYGHFRFINNIDYYFDNYIIALVQAGNREKAFDIINEKKKKGGSETETINISELNYYQEIGEWETGYAILMKLKKNEKKGLNPYTQILCEYEAKIGKIESALERAEYFHNKYPLDTNISFTYANLLREYKKYSIANPIYEEILTRYPYFDTWRENYDYCLLLAGDVETAMKEYKILSTHEPYCGDVFIGLGICMFLSGEKADGLRTVEDALKNKKFFTNPSPIYNLGKEILNNNPQIAPVS
jgi:tetratricopeptide (TPR) repeat protein